ncbi:hypothetical protein HDV01_003552 [Terramyces sp. JEL0728]|nr:hypothetical protein HDV01_003552 [Terramyces sp. JEL0728]
MNKKEIQYLARLPCLQRLAEFRTIEDVVQRRGATAQVHEILLKDWKKDTRWFGMGHHLVEEVHFMFRQMFTSLMQSDKVNVPKFKECNRMLHHHHSLEDSFWFPNLRKLHPEYIAEIDILEKDHKELVSLEKKIVNGDHEALLEFCNGLLDHLNREEMISVPYLIDGTGGL